MKKSARLVFFGTEDFSSASLEALIESGWKVVAVVTKPDKRAGRGQQLSPPAVKAIAGAQNIPVLQPKSLPEIGNILASFAPTHGVLVSYGAIVPQSILDIFPSGIINLHPSLLPLYRGPSPIEAAILAGDELTGLSLMLLNDKMDEGPIYARKAVKLNDKEDQVSLSGKLSALGAHFLIEKLHLITSGFLQPVAQENMRATYTKLLKKSDGKINLKSPAEVIERQIRAYLRFPKSKTRVGGHEIVVLKARVVNSENDGGLVLKCRPGWLEVEELIAPSGRTMSGADFLRGYKVS